MKHVKALAIKFISCFVLLYIILGVYYGMTFWGVFFISFGLVFVSYTIGDLLILPRTYNFVATLADFVMSIFIIWLMIYSLTFANNLFMRSLIASVGIAIFEFFFHKYMTNQVINNTQISTINPLKVQFQTEASEELTPNQTDLKKMDDEYNK
ncbi:YndM family protein [Bacillus sp. FJAT-49705]|uniref:YndM family protein n=1 Tax=Cytobacillus citreus TaxID=2833586 RepID=A0ABS5NSM2_9BACI|nr:YndM family protein [Cytobacillus citreus]MBS4190826.1 YndM family protein [Cytobacillus citreus]